MWKQDRERERESTRTYLSIAHSIISSNRLSTPFDTLHIYFSNFASMPEPEKKNDNNGKYEGIKHRQTRQHLRRTRGRTNEQNDMSTEEQKVT